jgi:hypothetical protein
MKSLSAAIIVVAGSVTIVSSQTCEALIRRNFNAWDSSIVILGLILGTVIITIGLFGWCYTLLTRSDSSRRSDQGTI